MQKQLNLKSITPFIIALSLIIGIWIGQANSPSSQSTSTSKLNHILSLITTDYVDSIDTDSIIEKSLPDIIAQLDPHSSYIPAKDLQATNDELHGSFSGIGISFNIMNDTINIIEVISGGPCEKVGVQAGDRIITIDNKKVAGVSISTDSVMALLKGPKNTKVTIGVKRRNSNTPISFEITRGEIPVNSVVASYIISPEIGYIKVDKFGEKTYHEFISALKKLSDLGAAKFIVDLRGNGGGTMGAALNMANEFLPDNKIIVNTKLRNREEPHFSNGNGNFQNSEVVVLIDEFSASASEIFAGALQDHDRGLIIGRRSFAKGLVQFQYELKDKSAIRLTIGRYYTPSGRCIQKQYSLGDKKYEYDIIERLNHGEAYNADSIKLNKDLKYKTANGRIVYGGGGIMPDVFVPNDTTELSKYYSLVSNAGLFQKFAFDYCDKNRNSLKTCKTIGQLLKQIPSDDELKSQFVEFAQKNKIAPRQFDIEKSKKLIVSLIKALIARDIIGTQGYYEIFNTYDNTVQSAISHINKGAATPPISINYK
ncbi:MAG: S41 family peptidase [Muribaculaceae bacterium]|nr:S41 family peptidase [Muribaculaceae bacterium]